MHDIDRTTAEMWETGPYETGPYETGLYETGQYEFEADQEFEGPFSEVEEMELASELLEITSEEELDQFLGNLFKKAARAVGGFMKGPLGKQLGGLLKGIAKKALPFVGGALGSIVPGVGTAIGGAVGSAASRLFEMELEGLSAEDQEFEVSRRFVRLAGEAAKRAAQAPQNVAPQDAARQALIAAAQQYAPGLLRQTRPAPPAVGAGAGRSGRWIRHGRKIILLGV